MIGKHRCDTKYKLYNDFYTNKRTPETLDCPRKSLFCISHPKRKTAAASLLYAITNDSLRSVLVGLPAELGLNLQSARSVVLLHDQFDQLDLVGAGESLVIQKSRELVLGVDRVRLAVLAFLATEGLENLGPPPVSVSKSEKHTKRLY